MSEERAINYYETDMNEALNLLASKYKFMLRRYVCWFGYIGLHEMNQTYEVSMAHQLLVNFYIM